MITRLNNQTISLSGFQFRASSPSLVISPDRFLFRGLKMSKEISIYGGSVTLVDNEDYLWLCQYSWHLGGKDRKYATTRIKRKGRYTTITMHRLIMERSLGRKLTEHEIVHHRHKKTLDNRKSELQLFHSWLAHLNEHRKIAPKKPKLVIKKGSCGYYGVKWSQITKKWQAFIFKGKAQIKLGFFLEIEEAALMYDKNAREIYGDNAVLNFPEWP